MPSILIAYDGSDDAQAAIAHAAVLTPGADATVLSIWEPDRHYDGGHLPGLGLAGAYTPSPVADAEREQTALAVAEEGAQQATAAGLVASARTAPRHDGIAHAILGVAREVDVDAIVTGTRGRSGVASFLLGSVSHALAQEADRPVLVVPSAGVVHQRRSAVEAAGAD